MDPAFSKLKGLIIDIDGTMTHHGYPIAGAQNAINQLREKGYSLRFLTNSTGRSPAKIAAQLNATGFSIQAEEVFTSVTACAGYLKNHFAGKSGYFAVPDNASSLLREMAVPTANNEQSPEFVVIGDLDEQFNYAILNRIFNFLH